MYVHVHRVHTHSHTHTHVNLFLTTPTLRCIRHTIGRQYTPIYRSIHKQSVHNVFMSCHCGQQENKSYSDTRPPKSDTDAANSFGVVTQASSNEMLARPNERVLLPGLWGVKAVLSGAGSQFTQGKKARQPGDKQLGLNKAFRYKSMAATSYLSCLLRPPLPLVYLLPW